MKPLYVLLIPLILFSCENSHPEMDMEYAYDAMREVAVPITEQVPPSNLKTSNSELTKKLIKRGQIHFQSESVTKDYDKIKGILSSYDAYIGFENEINSGYQIKYEISIRVASKNFDSLFYKLNQLSNKVELKSTNIEDVTERYYDLKTRIKNKKLLENKYVELLKRANSIKDILEIERSINQIRNEIETSEGSFRYLSKQVSYSSIQLRFYEVLSGGYQPDSFWTRITQAIRKGWQGFISTFIETVRFWPFIILLGLALYLFKKVKSYRKK